LTSPKGGTAVYVYWPTSTGPPPVDPEPELPSPLEPELPSPLEPELASPLEPELASPLEPELLSPVAPLAPVDPEPPPLELDALEEPRLDALDELALLALEELEPDAVELLALDEPELTLEAKLPDDDALPLPDDDDAPVAPAALELPPSPVGELPLQPKPMSPASARVARAAWRMRAKLPPTDADAGC
jgi:hypothetical protein